MVISKKWRLKTDPDQELQSKLINETNYSSYFIQLCLQRGLDSKEKIEQFIRPDESWFHDPYLIYDMEKARERILAATETGELITIYGDYDADGVTSTSILLEALEIIGANVNYYIPNRFNDGYGPNTAVFSKLISEGTNLIVTVDNGVAGHEAIEYAKQQNTDVIVTDHHEIPEELPAAYAIVHPKHPQGNYPFHDLSGAGVALKLAHALLDEFPVELLELAAVGTIADLVSLTDENRAIVKYGLQAMKESQRIGLQQLFKELDVSLLDIDESKISFKIAPILNALGRLESADKAVELLTTFDIEKAKELAIYLIKINEERKEIVSNITDEVLELMTQTVSNENVIVLSDENWHEGVLGIVASRIVKETGKPTILFKKDLNTGIAKGSARSIEAFNMYKECNDVRELFISFGGHHMAAGMSLLNEDIDVLKKSLDDKAEEIKKQKSFLPEIAIDLSVDVKDITIDAISEVSLLSPFGTDNPFPIIEVTDVKSSQIKRVGANKNHLKMMISKADEFIDVIGFQLGDFAEVLNEQNNISLVGTADINEWNGFKKPQIIIEDIYFKGPLVIDKRSSHLTQAMLDLDNSHFICFNDNIYDSVKNRINSTSSIQLIESKEDIVSNEGRQLVYVDCPSNIELFKSSFLENKDKKIIIYFYAHYNLFLKGTPKRNEFEKLYKYIASHKDIPIDTASKELSNYLKINEIILKFMIQVFLEADFVRISNGVLNIVEQPKRINIKDTKTFNEFNKQIEAEKIFVYNSFDELMGLLTEWSESI